MIQIDGCYHTNAITAKKYKKCDCAAAVKTRHNKTTQGGLLGNSFGKEPGIKLQLGVQLLNVPPEVGAELKEDLAGCRVAKSGKLDLAIIFVKNQEDLKKELSPLDDSRRRGCCWWAGRKRVRRSQRFDRKWSAPHPPVGRLGGCKGMRGERDLVRLKFVIRVKDRGKGIGALRWFEPV
jgi:hypothetical protein